MNEKANKIANKIAKLLEPKKTKGKKDNSKIKKEFCNKNKYLEQLGIKQDNYDFYADIKKKDKRWERWQKQRKNFSGICDADTWDMGLSIWPIRLYTELKMFMELSNEDMKQCEITYKDQKYTKDEYLNKIISLLEEYIVYYYITQPNLLGAKDFNYDYQKMYVEEQQYNEKYQEALRMLPEVVLGLWW